MAITAPATLQVPKAWELMLPKMAQQPLRKVLEDLNHLWRFHSPALASVCWTVTPALGRSVVFVVPISPSADGLEHNFEHRLMPSATSTCNVVVDYTTNYVGAGTAWVNVYNVNPATVAATLLTRIDAGQVLPATARALRVTYTPALGTVDCHHMLVCPRPTAAPAVGIKASGFRPFDDGLIVDADFAAVHTEWLNRCRISAVSLVRDRQQNALSWVQEEAVANMRVVLTNTTDFVNVPRIRVYFPGQASKSLQVEVRVLATVSAGGTADLVMVQQVGALLPEAPAKLLFAADGSINSATMTLWLQGDGLHRFADLEVSAKTTAGNSTYLKAVMAFWQPGA